MIAPVLPRVSSRFEICLAEPREDAEIRMMLRGSPIPGSIEVTFEREPGFFDACGIRGEFVQVGIGRDIETGRLVGLGTRTIAPTFVNGAAASIGYLADLRLEAEYRGGTLVARAYRFLRRLHADGRAQLYTTMIFADNHVALRTIASGRAGLPAYHDMGVMHCPGINLGGRRREIASDFAVVRGSKELLDEIVDCLNRNNARKQFAPLHDANWFTSGRWKDFRLEDFYVALRRDRVIGVIGRWDQRHFKQTRVIGYRQSLRWTAPMANILRQIRGLPCYPRAGNEIPYCYVSFIAIDNDNPGVFRVLLRHLYNDAIGLGWLYAILGLHERDPLRSVLREYSLTPFRGRLFCVCFVDGEEAFRRLDQRVPYVEAATL